MRPSCLAALVLALAAAPARAHDPDSRWRTLSTPSLRVHYPAGLYEQALDVARAGEQAYGELTRRLGWQPDGPIHIVYADEQDFAQGYAQSLPYNVVGLNAAAPEDISDLGAFDDWTYHLVAHELAHVVHIDTVLGMPRLVNFLFGRTLAPNGAQPRWFVEGLATYFESAMTSMGRVKSAYSDMVLRMAVLSGDPPTLDRLSGLSWQWPQGSAPYLFGGRFLDYIVRRFGEEALRDISHDYGGRLFPWAMNLSLERATGQSYAALWDDFLGSLRRRYGETLADLEVRGRLEGRALTARGQEVGAPRLAADGTIYYVASPLGGHTELVARTADGAERSVAWLQPGAALALEPGGRYALVSELDAVGAYRLYNDLYRVSLADGSAERLSEGLRAREPDVSPDGGAVVFAQNRGVESVIRVVPLTAGGLGQPRTLFDLGAASHVFGPRFSPDGGRVVLAAAREGLRDIWVVEIESGRRLRLTSDRALDGGPVFSPDGRWVLFHSDRDGIYNLYAVPAEGGTVRRLTRVLGGAFHPEPAPDGRVLYRTYGAQGFDLAELPAVDFAALAAAEVSPATELAPTARATVALYPSRPYSALETLQPRAWMPATAVDTRGSILGAALAGGDAVGRHAYAASAWWGLTSRFFGFVASYANRTFHPGLVVELGRSLGYAAFPYRRNGAGSAVEEEIWAARLSTSLPLYVRRDWYVAAGGAWELTHREATAPLVFAPDDRAPSFPDQGRFAAARLSLVASNVQVYPSSISPESGGRSSVSLRVEDPYVGSEYSAVSATIEHAHYVENPWIERHVLALRATAGLGDSSYRHRALFAVGGLPARDLLLDAISGLFGQAGGLRGFPLAPFAGDAMLGGSAEYRLPLVDIDSGYQTLPFYVRTLHAALFADALAIGDRPEDLPEGQHYSAGLELRLSMVLGDALPVAIRCGFGQGLGRDAEVRGYYLVLGQAF